MGQTAGATLTVRPRVAILDHPRSFFPLDLHEALCAHIEPVWVITQAEIEPNLRRLLQRLGTVVSLDEHDLDAAAAALAHHRLDGIVTFVDDLLVLVAELAARLDLRAHRPEVAEALVDKRRQRAVLARAGVPVPHFWSLGTAPAGPEIDRVVAAARFPVVVKEAEGSGSRNMYRVADAPELRALLSAPGAVERIVEEYLPDDPGCDPRYGGYVSVESIVDGEHVQHVALVGRTPLAEPLRETGVFAPALLTEVQRRAVLAVADEAIAALEVRHGILHTEIKLTPGRPSVIEVNGRLGGTPPYVIREATASRSNLFLAACRLAVGADPGIAEPLDFVRVAYWLVLQPPVWARRVTRVANVREIAELPGVEIVSVNRREGDPVDWLEGTLGHVMTVRGTAADHDDLAATLAAIEATADLAYSD